MTNAVLGPEHGELLLHTGVGGRAARMGHALTISIDDWHASVDFDGERALRIELVAQVASFRVVDGHGGIKPITEGDRATIRSTALRSLSESAHPDVTFASSKIDPVDGGFAADGSLSISGVTNSLHAQVALTDQCDQWRISCRVSVKQSDFGCEVGVLCSKRHNRNFGAWGSVGQFEPP